MLKNENSLNSVRKFICLNFSFQCDRIEERIYRKWTDNLPILINFIHKFSSISPKNQKRSREHFKEPKKKIMINSGYTKSHSLNTLHTHNVTQQNQLQMSLSIVICEHVSLSFVISNSSSLLHLLTYNVLMKKSIC